MVKEIKDDLVRVVILDISSIYAQIYNQGYFDRNSTEDIQMQFSDKKHWRVLIID